jgi:prepilin-type N-terminal cleavage/methylation domain-containing protein
VNDAGFDAHALTHMTKAFTLIELLVVVTIIVVLLALLTPALDKAIESAERVVCGSQLDLFGTAVPQYTLENRRTIPVMVVWGSYPHPLMVRPLRQHQPGQWNVQAMMPYVGGAEIDAATNRYDLDEPWYCPSNPTDKDPTNNTTANTGVLNGVNGDPYMDIDYSYFGRVEKWNAKHATRPEDFVGRQLGSGKVLMADTLFYYAQATWWLNHSTNGHSVHDNRGGGPVLRGANQIYAITGVQKLFGDGSVSWKPRQDFDADNLVNPALDQPWVSVEPGPKPNSSITFY